MKEGQPYIETGWAVLKEIDGVPNFWGILYEDGRSTVEGWGSVKTASIKRIDKWNKDTIYKPVDWTWKGSHNANKLKEGKVVMIQRITTFKVL